MMFKYFVIKSNKKIYEKKDCSWQLEDEHELF